MVGAGVVARAPEGWRMEEAQRPIARHDAILAAGAELLRFEGLTLDPSGRTLSAADGREIFLTRAEFELLSVLIRSRGRVLSRDQLLDAVAGRRPEPFDRSVDVLVGRLRRKIEPEPKTPCLVLTVPGHGYKFAAKPAQVVAEQEESPTPASIAEEPLTPLATPTAERRLLTVMVCSLSGATGCLARLDPEERHGIVRTFRTCCGDICNRFSGVLGPVVGDTVHVYFGFPLAHEHDAEQAIRAGLAVAAVVQRLDVGLAVRLDARVGIATGDTVASDGLADVSGEAPALAQRLAARAASGTVVVGPTTLRLAGGLFEYRPLPEADGMPAETFQGTRRSNRGDLIRCAACRPPDAAGRPHGRSRAAAASLASGASRQRQRCATQRRTRYWEVTTGSRTAHSPCRHGTHAADLLLCSASAGQPLSSFYPAS